MIYKEIANELLQQPIETVVELMQGNLLTAFEIANEISKCISEPKTIPFYGLIKGERKMIPEYEEIPPDED